MLVYFSQDHSQYVLLLHVDYSMLKFVKKMTLIGFSLFLQAYNTNAVLEYNFTFKLTIEVHFTCFCVVLNVQTVLDHRLAYLPSRSCSRLYVYM